MLKFCISAVLVAVAIAGPVNPTLASLSKDVQCASNAYPPAQNTSVPTFVINLDLPPEERWTELVTAKNASILRLRDALVQLIGSVLDGAILKIVDDAIPFLGDTLPSPFKEEMEAMSKVTGMPLGEVVIYNVFYEFFTVCTSIVAQNEKGEILHARNLDFGLFLGWDKVRHTWAMTQVLRENVVQLEWQKGGKTLFKSVNFAGYIGLLTATTPGKMSFTIDERFNTNGGFIGLVQWLMGNRDLKWVGFLAREVFEQQLDYSTAVDTLTKAKLIAPVYFIVGGSKAGEGCLLTKDRNSDTADVYTMKDNGAANYGDWYVLETNYDHWAQPPFFDDRRTSGHKCMLKMGQSGANFEGLFNVLSTQPNLNKLTAYTALINVNTGEMETYLQDCVGDCTPW